MNEDTIVRFSASGRKIILVSGEVSGYLQGIAPSEGVKVKHPRNVIKYTKHDGRAVLFAVAELFVLFDVDENLERWINGRGTRCRS